MLQSRKEVAHAIKTCFNNIEKLFLKDKITKSKMVIFIVIDFFLKDKYGKRIS
jgi:hypothetical protein